MKLFKKIGEFIKKKLKSLGEFIKNKVKPFIKKWFTAIITVLIFTISVVINKLLPYFMLHVARMPLWWSLTITVLFALLVYTLAVGLERPTIV